jgi:dihydroxy-acid dehydratase
MAGHVAPEAARGGPLAAVRDGDTITLNIPARQIRLEIADGEIRARMAQWQPPPPRFATGVLGRYARQVSSAAIGAVIE